MAKRKVYSANELKAAAGDFFGNNEGVTNVYATSDGYFFKSENRAILHASQKGLSVYTYTRTQDAPDVEEDQPDFLAGNVATVINGISSLTRVDAGSYRTAEESGKNRKTVIKALSDYIDKCPTAISIAAIETPKVGEEHTLALTFTPDPTSNDKVDTTVYFESSDEEKATVDENGVVTCIDTGEVVITATAQSGYESGTRTITIGSAD